LEDKRNKALLEAIEHSRKATELFRLSLEVHQAEQCGEMDQNTAIDRALSLNDQALNESDAAMRIMRRLMK
jgi:hypothetical protein